MHYYQFNVGDYASHTRHLSLMEDLAYRRLLDLAYTTEKPLANDAHALSRIVGMRDYQSEIEDVLKEFFELVSEGWIHNRVLKEMEAAGGRKDKAKLAANVRWDSYKHNQAMLANAPSIEKDTPSIENDAKNAPSMKNDATQDTRHNTHKSKAIVASDAGRLCPHEKIIEIYHSALPVLPAVRVWTEPRKKKLSARWREDVKRQSLDYWTRFFEYVAKSDFLCGRTPKPFTCDLEWLVTSANFVKIIEGKYENK